MSHVLDKFQFCPVCGSNHFEINNIKSKKCKDCGFSYYLNPSSATVALILNSKKELLAVRRKKDPAKGALDLPGGFVDMDETGEEGMAREVKRKPDWMQLRLSISSATQISTFTQVSWFIPSICSMK